jgi:hypothetical protein
LAKSLACASIRGEAPKILLDDGILVAGALPYLVAQALLLVLKLLKPTPVTFEPLVILLREAGPQLFADLVPTGGAQGLG